MKWLTAGLTFVNVSTICALLLGIAARGLSPAIAVVSLGVGIITAVLAYLGVSDPEKKLVTPKGSRETGVQKQYHIWYWLLAACFAFFAFRSFCWLLFFDGNDLKVQSPNNLGDLALHIAYIKNFASGVPLWPENPIHVFSNMRYPAGTDLFNALLLLSGMDIVRGLVWAGLIGSWATFFALYRWGRAFGVAGFLFNGGLAGFQFVQSFQILDYQGVNYIAWKSLPLAMLVTQRGLLYALPAGLLLLYQWRSKYLAPPLPQTERAQARPPLPFWLEITLYASMPLFHIHTFMALSIVAGFLFLTGEGSARKQLAVLVGFALLPATYFVWTITDHFQARSLLQWKPGWVQTSGDFAGPFFQFWINNFGLFLPLALWLVALCVWRAWKSKERFSFPLPSALAFIASAIFLFLFACLVKTAPWEWDNIKLIIWAYLIILPFLWSELIGRWLTPVRVGACVVLFGSGFVSLFGGLAAGRTGYGLGDRAEVDGVGSAVRRLPPEARFAAYPTYNHPLLLQGRKVVLGYPGHLWTQGFDYREIEKKLNALMLGAAGWRQNAHDLRVRYLFWGREEKAKYTTSTKPWEQEAQLVASGSWGAIYDLNATPQIPVRPRQ